MRSFFIVVLRVYICYDNEEFKKNRWLHLCFMGNTIVCYHHAHCNNTSMDNIKI
jgi:hypothetical protein